jgi:uncharacterized FlaG/YvyC family protein
MYLDRKQICSPTARFDVPHKAEPVSALYIAKKFPEFAKEMDGGGEERCLLYFWKRNKETKVYEFIDEVAEEEVAEMLGVRIYNEEEEKEKAKQKYLEETRALTEEEIRSFKEELAHASQQMKEFLKSTNKTRASSSPVQQEEESEEESN